MKLTEKLAELQQVDFAARCEALEEAWGDDPEKMAMFDNAVEMVKEAEAKGAFGPEGLTDAAFITLAAEVVQHAVKLAEEAAAQEVEEVVESAPEEAAEEVVEAVAEQPEVELSYAEALFKGAMLAAELLGAAGISYDELTKQASAEEQEELGRFMARYVVNLLTEEAEASA